MMLFNFHRQHLSLGVLDTAEIHYPNWKGIILSNALTWKFNCTFIKHIVQCLLKHSLSVFLCIQYLYCHPFQPEKFHSVNNASVFCIQFVSMFYWCEEVVYHDIFALLQIKSHPLKSDMFLESFINRVHLFLSQAIQTIHEVFSILVHQKPNLSHLVTKYCVKWHLVLNIRSYSKSLWLWMLRCVFLSHMRNVIISQSLVCPTAAAMNTATHCNAHRSFNIIPSVKLLLWV